MADSLSPGARALLRTLQDADFDRVDTRFIFRWWGTGAIDEILRELADAGLMQQKTPYVWEVTK